MKWVGVVAAILAALLGASVPAAAQDGKAAAPAGPPEAPVREVQVASEAFSLGDPLPAWVEVTAVPPATATGPVVVRLSDSQFLAGDSAALNVHRALLVNDVGSLTDIGQIPIGFVPQYQKLQLHAVRILRGDQVLDRTRSSSVRFLQRETGLGNGVYSGTVTASVLVEDLRVGDTLEYQYSILGDNPVFGGKFFNGASWDSGSPTELRRVVLSYPAARSIGWKLVGDGAGPAPTVTTSEQGGLKRLVFEGRAVAAVRGEPYTPPDFVAYRWLQFSEFASWAEVVAWAEALFRVDGDPDPELQQAAQRIAALPSAEERVAAALAYVQDQIRYFSVALGESSHRPAQPGLVLRRRYGDCKDKSLLLVTLLKALGIDSRPVLLRFYGRQGVDRMLPSPTVFDHAIVQVRLDGQAYYLDPTRLGQQGRLSRMGQVHEGVQVLVIDPASTGLDRIISPDANALARDEMTEVAALTDFAGDGTLEVSHVWNGLAAESARAAYQRAPDDLGRWLDQQTQRKYPAARAAGKPEVADDPRENRLTVTARYVVPKMAEARDAGWMIRFGASNFSGTFAPPPANGRAAPLGIPGHPLDGRYSFEVKLPENVSALWDPVTQVIENKYFSYRLNASFRGNLARTVLDLKLLADRIEPADLVAVQEDLKQMSRSNLGNMVLINKADIKTAAGEAPKELSAMIRERLRQTVERTTTAIASGKLAGQDLAATYCVRAEMHGDLGEFDGALSDAEAAVKLMPDDIATLACRGSAHFAAGRFQQSVADYSRAVALGDVSAGTYFRRGISRYYLGQLPAAADDLQKALQADDKQVNRYAELWLTWTLKQLGRPLPEEVAKRVQEEPKGEWPLPALAMLAEQLTPQDMTELLERKQGDDRILGQAEGNFYLGQYHLLHGDKTEARRFFEKTRALGVLFYIEHIAAGFELEKLKRTD